jgi:hypothetical protein
MAYVTVGNNDLVLLCRYICHDSRGNTGEPPMTGPDDIERRLREIEAEFGPARVTEPSAAERARQSAQQTRWRNYDFGTYDDPGGPLEPWMRTVSRFDAGAQCRADDGFVHPYFPGAIRNGTPTGSPVNPYDQGTLPAQIGGCRATTGT